MQCAEHQSKLLNRETDSDCVFCYSLSISTELMKQRDLDRYGDDICSGRMLSLGGCGALTHDRVLTQVRGRELYCTCRGLGGAPQPKVSF